MAKLPLVSELPSYIKRIKLKFPARCRCSKRFKAGQSAFYDGDARKTMCGKCLQVRLTEPPPPSDEPAQMLVRRFAKLMAVPRPRPGEVQVELQRILEQFRLEYAGLEYIRRLLLEYFELELPRNQRCYQLSFDAKCVACQVLLPSRSAAVWDIPSKRTWCFSCLSIEAV